MRPASVELPALQPGVPRPRDSVRRMGHSRDHGSRAPGSRGAGQVGFRRCTAARARRAWPRRSPLPAFPRCHDH